MLIGCSYNYTILFIDTLMWHVQAGGHAALAPRTQLELELVEYLKAHKGVDHIRCTRVHAVLYTHLHAVALLLYSTVYSTGVLVSSITSAA
jgi:hypothetical protein